MAVPAAASVRDANRYRPPQVTGLVDLLDRQVRERPCARALVVTGARVRLSYRALASLADEVAARLGGAGLGRGDAVGLICANTAEFVVALLGAARAGLVAAPLDPALPEAQLALRLGALGARAVLIDTSASGRDVILPVPAWSLRVDVSGAGTAAVALEPGVCDSAQVQGAAGELSERDALVLFTAGTTDRAKMVPLTHDNVAASLRTICATYELGPDDATVAVMPFFHGHGLFAALLSSLASGGCVLLPERGRFSAGTFWDDMRAVHATWFTAVPAIHEILLDRSEREYPGAQAPPLKFVRSCSAPLNTATQRALERTFGAPLLSAYGMTESSHQATSEPLPQRGALRQGSVGRPTGVAVRVVDRSGRSCPAGVEGEVWVQGATVARGYLADGDESARTFVDGWLRTGDLGALDEDGYLSLTGRIKNLINRGGEKISPEHVEDILAGCPGVAEAAVFAVPDAVYGQRVGAAVVVREPDGVGREEILRYCRDHLAAFEVPDRLELVNALPYTAKGGLDRKAVQVRYAP
ncbi:MULTISPECIES: FadD7 family fatty acid--CoA ligase [Streptomyces]|uniref:Dicarboxylate-CoA ligase PimA n=1 Tax=Streptomyces sviceus (strain ATCC 29083 / DSM 924 / JCM 4929 / NBRC 13980 / NCIMB 11184 / NRRL 5439 / UC 5370) TaxID=463191 RepID=B5I9A6_STRX2|nr:MULTISPECIES: FadD7 family fatty acid--CoA ligase [Streptomyces]EDY61661.1 dicarboxylate-CoA ligase PimA [Streptomyces sviceus ATCC 29083]MYT09626.1 AMP-binding protein [Streptomyces sp. SID5470]